MVRGYTCGHINEGVSRLDISSLNESHLPEMIAPLAPLLSMALTEFGALSWAASPVDPLSSDTIASDDLPGSSVSTLMTASYVLVVDYFLFSI